MNTVRKNQWHKIAPRITDMQVISLSNCFCAEAVERTPAEVLELERQFGARLAVNESTSTGKLSVHSNLWYEFKLTSATL